MCPLVVPCTSTLSLVAAPPHPPYTIKNGLEYVRSPPAWRGPRLLWSLICMIDSTFIQTLSEHEQCWYSTRRPEGSSGDHSSHEGPKHYSDTFFPLICHTSVCPLCSDWTKTLTVLMFPSISVCPMLGCWPSVYCLTFKKNLPWKGNRGAEKTENRTIHCGFAFLMKMNLILCHSWQL